MADDRLGAQDSIGIVLTNVNDGSKRIVRDLATGVADMAEGKTEVQLEEIFRYCDELRQQHVKLLNERRDMQQLIKRLGKKLDNAQELIDRQEGYIEGYREKLDNLS